ncbi:UDP-N-acetylmuramoyl-tripeptide--D-alanyl-D-alanine ligase [soil metagenome]
MVGPDVEITGASFDGREVTPGQLFVPLVADRDGHEFVSQAIGAGAVAYLTSRPANPDVAASAVEVADTADALMDVAAWATRRLDVPVVGITGSVGKTSTKDLAATAIGSALRVAANVRSFNNEQGLPVTVLGASDDVEVLVLEMGMRGFGQITRLCAAAPPTIGIVTAVAPSHTELVGGIEGVARAKAELVAALPASGVAVLNADDERVAAMAAASPAPVLRCGEAPGSDVRIVDLVLDDWARPSFRLETPWGAVDVGLAVTGRHMAANAVLALAAACALGVPMEVAADALGAAGLSPSRMALHRPADGVTVIDDAYNANPTSMRAALDTLASIPAGRRVAVVGMMAELHDPVPSHRGIADYASVLGIELVTVGTDLYGPPPTADPVAAVTNGDTTSLAVLVKASRVAQLDRVARALVRELGDADYRDQS